MFCGSTSSKLVEYVFSVPCISDSFPDMCYFGGIMTLDADFRAAIGRYVWGCSLTELLQ
jgi:hypothetical protein